MIGLRAVADVCVVQRSIPPKLRPRVAYPRPGAARVPTARPSPRLPVLLRKDHRCNGHRNGTTVEVVRCWWMSPGLANPRRPRPKTISQGEGAGTITMNPLSRRSALLIVSTLGTLAAGCAIGVDAPAEQTAFMEIADAQAPYDQRFIDEMVMHHQGADRVGADDDRRLEAARATRPCTAHGGGPATPSRPDAQLARGMVRQCGGWRS